MTPKACKMSLQPTHFAKLTDSPRKRLGERGPPGKPWCERLAASTMRSPQPHPQPLTMATTQRSNGTIARCDNNCFANLRSSQRRDSQEQNSHNHKLHAARLSPISHAYLKTSRKSKAFSKNPINKQVHSSSSNIATSNYMRTCVCIYVYEDARAMMGRHCNVISGDS